jgi:endonuclease YncB( thermonuclease family)
MMRFILIGLLAFATPYSAHAEIAGRASVIDGDTIEIAGQRIGLFGIDAPESAQLCVAESQWRCGQQAASSLSTFIGSHMVHCSERDRDQDQRVVAVCRLSGPTGPDLNAMMVSEGWALAYRDYSTDYVADEQDARVRRVGIWRGSIQAPWDWRVMQQAKVSAASVKATPAQLVANNAAGAQCRIKGDVNDKGKRIYHVPGGKHYEATQVNPANGERWFCSEAEASKAGWQKSKR